MYNSGRRGKRAPDGYGIISVNEQFNQTEYPIPIINSYAVTDGSYVATDDLALDTTGGQTVVIYGSGFKSGITVNINGTNRTTTLLDSSRLAITSPALSSGTYTIYASNSDGATAVYVPGLIYSGTPTWSTGTSLGTEYESNTYSQELVATSDSTITYTLADGSTLPSGVNLTSGGSLSGTLPAESGSTTYTFTVVATDTELQETTRQFSLTVNTDVVTWSTPSANYVISAYEYSPISNVTASATSAAGYGMLYAANTLPSGFSLDVGSGLISGSNNTVGNTYTRLTATANTSTRSATRDVIFNVNQDVVTWSSPANETNYALGGGSPMANVTMSATSAAGKSILYSANALPTGVYIDGGTLYGTPSVAETVYTQLTATAVTTNRSATRTISWTISLGDSYWKNVSLLLNGVTPTPTFINDASINNTQLTIVGDVKPNNFNPYTQGYYSNYFDGTGDYLTAPSTGITIGTGDFTLEGWFYFTGTDGTRYDFFANNSGFLLYRYSDNTLSLYTDASGANKINVSGFTAAAYGNKWIHIALTRQSGSTKLFINGTQAGSTFTSDTTNYTGTTMYIGRNGSSAIYYSGYISNFRVVKGTALYTTTFTPPTGPLTSIANTALLTCQSNRLIDNSPNNYVITKNGDTTVSPAQPFATPTTAAYNTQYSTYFDGTGDYLQTTLTGQSFGTGDFTIEGWVYNTGAVTNAGVFQLNSSAFGGLAGIALAFYAAAGGITTYYGGTQLDGTISLSINTWYHFAVVRISGSLKTYINGELISTVADSTNYTATTLVLGGYYSSSYLLTGYISNFRVVKGVGVYTGAFTPPTSALTSTQSSGTNIAAITTGQTVLLTCQDSTLKDNSTNNFAITSVADAKPLAISPFTMTTANNTVTSLGSAYFDGTGDYLNNLTTPFKFTGDFTVEAWVYPTSYPGNQNTVMSIWNSTLGFIFKVVSGNRISFYGYPGTTIGCVATSTTVDLNKWNHVAATRSGSTIRLFVNGVLDATTATMTGSFTGTTDITIGSLGTIELWNGWIADARIVNGTALYTTNFLPPQAPLTPVANTALLTCQTNGGGNNNGFVDQSSFNNIITRSGNVTQGTFSPFSQTGLSNYFDGSSTYYFPSNAAMSLGAGAYTVEGWVNAPTGTNNKQILVGGFLVGFGGYSGSTVGALRFYDGSITAVSNASYLIATGTWNHFAIVRENTGTNGFKMYVNGILAYVGTTASNPTIGDMYVGSVNTSTDLLTGYISNLRLVKGTAVYTTASTTIGTQAFTPPTTPLTAIANTSLLTAQSNRLIDNSPYNFTPTISSAPKVQAYSPFGGITSTPTSYSNYFDGSGDYLTVPNNTAFDIGSNNFTIESWIYPTSIPAQAILFCKTPNSSSYGSFEIRLNTNRTLLVYVSSAGTGWDFNFTTSNTVNLNAWNHISLTRTTGGLYTIWINGQSGATYTWNYTMWNSTHPIAIGAYGNGANPFTGYMSNARIVNGQALYTSNFEPSTTPLTTTSQGATASQVSLLTCQSNRIVDNSPNYFALTAAGDVKPKYFNPFGTTTTSTVSYTPSVNGGSMYFDGTGDYLTTSSVTSLSLGTGDYTIECWVYVPSYLNGQAYACIWESRTTSTDAAGHALYFRSSNSTLAYRYGATEKTTPYTNVPLNAWVHLAVVRNASGTALYINGVNNWSGLSVTNDFSRSIYNIGRTLDNYYFTGYISDMRITKGTGRYVANFYPDAAPATPTNNTVLLLNGTSGGIIDYHGTNNLETVGNVQLASEDPYSGSYYSNYFDGTGDYLSNTTNNVLDFNTDDFTVEYWVYYTAAINNNFQCHVGSPDTSTSIGFGTNVSGALYATTSTTGYTGSTAITPGTWQHIAWSRSSGTLRGFLNGVQVYSESVATAFTGTGFGIGGSKGGSYLFAGGNISNVRVVKGVAVYTSAFTPPATPLSAISGTSLLTCQSNKFIDNSTNNFALTRNGDTKVKSFNPFRNNTGKSLYFDGTADRLSVLDNPNINLSNGNFTIECWAYFNNISSEMVLINKGWQSSSAYASYLIYMNNTGSLRFGSSSSGGSWDIANEKVIGTMTAGKWTHISVTRSGSTFRAFIDGVIVDTFTFTSTASLANIPAQTLFIGGRTDAVSSMNGYIEDVRITKGTARYTANTTPPTTTFEVK